MSFRSLCARTPLHCGSALGLRGDTERGLATQPADRLEEACHELHR